MKEEKRKILNFKKKKSASPMYFGMEEASGKQVAVCDVERGLACGCICLVCGTRLKAKKGDERRHHFAHESNKECLYGAEIAIYQAFYEVLKNTKRVFIPNAVLRVGPYEAKEIKPGCVLELSDVKLDNDPVVYPPELFCYAGENRFRVILDIESYYNDSDFAEIKAYAKQNDIPIVVVDIDDIWDASSFEDIKKYIELPNCKWWLYNRNVEREKQRLIEAAKQQKQVRQKKLEDKKCEDNLHDKEDRDFFTEWVNKAGHTEKNDNQEELCYAKNAECHEAREHEICVPSDEICPKCGKKLKEMPSKSGSTYICPFGCRIYVRRDTEMRKIVNQEV